VLWETVAAHHPEVFDWRWQDVRLERIKNLGMNVIAGLLHHGSGPSYTQLLDPALPEKFAAFARAVAARYPWITAFTPVNEPLTTARFSGLYGHWHPHLARTSAFLCILVNQCCAVKQAMRAIREVTPGAKLIQTEDLGKTFATPQLQYQADYENERRWLGFDLLCGRVDRSHQWRTAFLRSGVSSRELDEFVNDPCPPDIIGINHYLSSDRFLDDRLTDYPERLWAGNGKDRYVDVEAHRSEGIASSGVEARLLEAWERYRLPLALTEVHNGCTREEQLRWLDEAWRGACRMKRSGADIRAVTIWSLLGAVDWNSLLTRKEQVYEPGVFDVRSQPIRRTALAGAVQSLVRDGHFKHPVSDQAGWWRRPDRFHRASARQPCVTPNAGRRLLIVGRSGTLGQAFARICDLRGICSIVSSRSELDIADAASVRSALQRSRPWAVINTAGFVRVADAEREAQLCFRENTVGVETLAEACAKGGVPLVSFSSDLVFSGRGGAPYREDDLPSPECVYGRSKSEAERCISAVLPSGLVVRTSAFFGPWDRHNFAFLALRAMGAGIPFQASDTDYVSPTYVPDLVHATLDLLIDGEQGIWHLANRGYTSWFDFAVALARHAKVPTESLMRAGGETRRSFALASNRGEIMPPLESAIRRFILESQQDWRSVRQVPRARAAIALHPGQQGSAAHPTPA
jgi:dTDP-4-dehydrorhamnose reductase